MPSKLLIVKDNRDHISTIVHELAKVWSIRAGKENLRVFGIHDYDEFDAAFKCNFVLFLLNNETLSFENQVPKWLRKLGHYGRPTNNKFKYLVVRELRPISEQIHIADRTESFWTENETERQPNERNTDATHLIDVDEISRILKWWPCVIQHTFKTRNARFKVHVETDANSLFDGSEVKLKVERTRDDIQGFLAMFNALRESSEDSISHLLFIIGDPSKFDTPANLRHNKINGIKIMLILVGENKHHPNLPISSTSLMFSSNMVCDVLQVMVDLGIVGEQKTFKKTMTVNQVKDPTKAKLNETEVKITWSFKSQDDVLSDPGYVSVQMKIKFSAEWVELARKKASVSTDEIIIGNSQNDDEFRVMFEDAKTGSLSTPICIKYPPGHQCMSVTNRILCFVCTLIVFLTVLEGYLIIGVFTFFNIVLFQVIESNRFALFYTTGFAISFEVIVFVIFLIFHVLKIQIGINVICLIVASAVHCVLFLLSCIYLIIIKDFLSNNSENKSMLKKLFLLLKAQVHQHPTFRQIRVGGIATVVVTTANKYYYIDDEYTRNVLNLENH